ncbi:MAG: trypsin-like peptidase domain-containing protein [Gammaproteobacteria bacterium]|nr:trypsin-like peptidase domain-containing protein [Gammaproteobacteria bacterium]
MKVVLYRFLLAWILLLLQPALPLAQSQGTSSFEHAITDPQLDVKAMECLHGWLLGKGAGGNSISPEATLEVARGQGSTAGTGACAVGVVGMADDGSTGQMVAAETAANGAAPLPPMSGETGPGGVESLLPATGDSGTKEVITVALPEAPPLQQAAVILGLGTSVGSGTDPLIDAAKSPSLAPPVGDLLAALAAPETAPTAPVRSIDVNSDGNVSSAVVLVVTPATSGTGVLLDYAGHVLANWHVVRGYPSVSITFKASDGASPSAARTHSAQVVRLSKTADLALLRIDNPPKGVTPVRIAKTNEIRNGDIVHAVGHPKSANWAYTLGKIVQVKPGSSWYAGHNLLHRGTVILAELPDNPGSAGAPLFNNALELVGIGATPRSSRGVLTGVSMETIRQFLQAPSAEARASTGG